MEEFIGELYNNNIFIYLEDGKLVTKAPKGAITSEIGQKIKSHKDELLKFLNNNLSLEATSTIKIKPNKSTKKLLSFAQQRLWFADQIEPGNSQYNMPMALQLEGDLNIHALSKAFETIIARHHVLHTIIQKTTESHEPFQIKQIDYEFSIPVIDLTDFNLAEQEQTVHRYAEEEATLPFDFSSDLMIRAKLLKCTEPSYILLITIHHIASDGWSQGILINELSSLYRTFVTGIPNPLPELTVQYSDYAQWQRDLLQGEVLDSHLNFWKQRLQGLPKVHSLPLDRARPPIQNHAGAHLPQMLNVDIQQGLNALAIKHDATLFMVLNAAFAVLLSYHSNENDIVVGTPVANRDQPELAPLVGFFVNALVLRTNLSDNPRFDVLLQRCKEYLLGAYEHQQLPYETLIDELKLERSLSYSPLFQIMLVLQNNDKGQLDLPGLTLKGFKQSNAIAKHDLSLDVVEQEDGLYLSWEYATSLFDSSTIKRLAQHFEILLKAIIDYPETPISELPCLTSEEEYQLLVQCNETASDYPKDKCIHELFEEQVKLTPDAPALVFGRFNVQKGEELIIEQLTYQELNAKANQVANYLIEQGVQPDNLIVLCAERSIEMMIGTLGILKAGGAYVPIDPNAPENRIEHMLQNSGAKFVLTESHLLSTLPLDDQQILLLDSEMREALLTNYSSENIAKTTLNLAPHHLAYVIYTSGSTGTPKATLLEHKGLCNLAFDQIERFKVTQKSRILQFASFAFDGATFEWVMALCWGAQLCLTSQKTIHDSHLLGQYVQKTGITHAIIPPALLAVLTPNDWINVKHLITSGESCPLDLAKQWSQNRYFYNGYGPTEATVCTTINPFHSSDTSFPIGKPISNVNVYVLNQYNQLLPVGVVGELYIGGDSLARGYHNHPELTAQKFVHNPFSNTPSAKLYKTGDLVRWLPNAEGHPNNLEFIGRVDHQVKIRGFRIELGEIESNLLKHEAVAETAIVVKGTPPCLVSYVVSPSQTNNDIVQKSMFVESLRTHLKQSLPDYMIPAAFVLLDQLPLNTNGKIDYHKLPEPDISEQLSHKYAPPQTEVEKQLCAIWQSLLKIERVGLTNNFFELGGHSLLAVRLVSEVRSHFQVDINVSDIFEKQTLHELASLISTAEHTNIPLLGTAPDNQPLALSFAQQRLWFIDQMEPGNYQYNISMALELEGKLHINALSNAFQTIIERHHVLRTTIRTNETGEPFQVVHPNGKFSTPLIDLTDLDYELQKRTINRYIEEEASKPFNLSIDKMVRVKLLRIAQQSHIMLVTMHHIAADGWSQGILIKEFSTLYRAYVAEEENPLPQLEIQYADYAHWQQKWLQGEVLDRHIAFWKEKLQGLPDVHHFPLDHPRPSTQSYEGSNYNQILDFDIQQGLNKLARAHDATLFMVLNAAFAALLSRYSNETDIVIGTPIANREQTELTPLVGFFLNSLVLRTDLSGNPCFNVLLQRCKDYLLEAYQHQQLPFEKLVDELQPERSLSYSTLFQVMLILQNNEKEQFELPGLTLKGVQHSHSESKSVAKYDISLYVSEKTVHSGKPQLVLNWEYATDLFECSTIKQMAKHFESLLNEVIADPTQPIAQIQLLSDVEKKQQLQLFNSPTIHYLGEQSIQRCFEMQVKHSPNAIAAVFEQKQISYLELNRQANRVARFLIEKGVQSNTLVGIYAHRSIDFLVGILSILKAGGAYVPLDPNNPSERLSYIIDDAKLHIVLSQKPLAKQFKTPSHCQFFYLDDEKCFNHYNDTDPISQTSGEDYAYMIYTSGSTGRPKGALVHHAGALNHINAEFDLLGFMKEGTLLPRNFLQSAAASSDVSVWQFLAPIVSGGKTVILDDMTNLPKLVHLLQNEQVHLIQTAPVVLQVLVTYLENLENQQGPQARILPDLQWLMTIADACPVPLINQWFTLYPHIPIMNGFGPSEASDDITYHIIQEALPAQLPSVPIGKPIPNMTLYVLDKQQQLVPMGVVGELCVSGVGVGPGYWNNAERNAKSFLENPYKEFPGVHGERLYRTGDLGRWRTDGTLEFLGRLDNQVKIRGFRVELGEVEAALSRLIGIGEVAVLVHDNHRDKHLSAYIVLKQDFKDLTAAQIRSHLKRELPEYMIPHSFTFLESMPLNAADKIDRHKLPAPTLMVSERDYIAPSNEIEKQLCQIWQTLLNVEKVGINDNFFELGGHSLLAIQLISQIQRKLSLTLPVKILFAHPKLVELASYINDYSPNDPPFACYDVTSLATDSSQPILFIAPALGMMSIVYQTLANTLTHSFNVKVLTTPGIDEPVAMDSELLTFSLSQRVTQWYEAIKRCQPSGHYQLLGHSLGGSVVFELAHRLEKAGDSVEIVLLDSVLARFSVAEAKPLDLAGILLPQSVFASAPDGIASSITDEALFLQLLEFGLIPKEMGLEQFKVYVLAARQQINFYNSYQPSSKIAGKATLIMAEQGIAASKEKNAIIDYIQSWCKQTLSIDYANGTHHSIVQSHDLYQKIVSIFSTDSSN